MPKPKLTPEQEALGHYMAAATAAYGVLVKCLQENGALSRGQVPEALNAYMQANKERDDPIMLSMLHDLRLALLD
ncbi:MAG: hypothetical protein ACRECY_17845 [Phyllobacterium sp.]